MGVLFKLSDYRKSSVSRVAEAYGLYQQASAIDEDKSRYKDAAALYQRAIALDPLLDIAYTNLGNVYFRLHYKEKATEFYKKALDLNPKQVEALYNLGYLHLETGDAQEALFFLLESLEEDPQFADAHYNAALAYEQLSQYEKAQPHWRACIKLEPSGTWSEIAKRHINDEQESPKQTTSCSRVRGKGQVRTRVGSDQPSGRDEQKAQTATDAVQVPPVLRISHREAKDDDGSKESSVRGHQRRKRARRGSDGTHPRESLPNGCSDQATVGGVSGLPQESPRRPKGRAPNRNPQRRKGKGHREEQGGAEGLQRKDEAQ